MPRRFLLLLLLLVGCSAATNQAPPPSAAPGAPEVRQVSMRLQWFPQWQFAGYIVALRKGYYADAGLEVTLLPGGPDLVPLPLVAAGNDSFGSTGADTILIAREQGIPVVALATWFQTSPVAFMVHSDAGISGPQDFVGRRVAMFYGDNVETEYLAMLQAAEVDRSAIQEIPGDYSIAPFLERRIDVWPVYATDQPNTARRLGAEVDLIFARDYGVQLLGDVLFTTESFLHTHPRTVAAFVTATLRGWEDALANPDEAIELILAYNPELEREQLIFEASETIKLLRYGAGERCLGLNDPTVWQAQADLMQQLELLSDPPNLEAAIQGQFVACP
ncbi:MAG: ABC transporter substrate-binding protein [Candidatus Viridilinea halotolerans]|uniref:Thiamine pyrimidine synthase n=1 Tax=Candidatus Viridilinea halotolerans TaxID=2491704 RepID=A0A426TXA2_9CHLR|nr:MAG: ABC transporter substrate-binding protein [Candidatus Viridilinea halotolerans]